MYIYKEYGRPLNSMSDILLSGISDTIEWNKQFPSAIVLIGTRCRTVLLACLRYSCAIVSMVCFVSSNINAGIMFNGEINSTS